MTVPSPPIDILLATYNGQVVLPALLASLRLQTFTNWRIIAHDDGSTDETVRILRECASVEPRLQIVEDHVRLGSAQGNFMHLLKFSSAPYCIFCDDDDIWLENKLQVLYDTISQRDNGIPQAVWCNSYVYEPVSAGISGFASLAIMTNLKDTLFCNAGIQGCAILFNAQLREVCKRVPDEVAMHDHLLTLAAMTFGEMTYVPKRLMLYRRYEGTVTGHTDKSLPERASRFFKKGKTVIDARHFRAAKSFYEINRDRIPQDKDLVFQRYFAYPLRGRLANAFHVLTDGFKLYDSRLILFVKMLTRPTI